MSRFDKVIEWINTIVGVLIGFGGIVIALSIDNQYSSFLIIIAFAGMLLCFQQNDLGRIQTALEEMKQHDMAQKEKR